MLLQICLSEVVNEDGKHTEQNVLLSKGSHKDNFSNFTLLYSLAFRWLDFFTEVHGVLRIEIVLSSFTWDI